MDKDDLLKHIAETGYNVGFGAKLHFATYDIVDWPYWLYIYGSWYFFLVCKRFDKQLFIGNFYCYWYLWALYIVLRCGQNGVRIRREGNYYNI